MVEIVSRGRPGKPLGKLKAAEKGIFRLDEQKLLLREDLHIDAALCVLRDLPHRVDRVVDDVAEQHVLVGDVHEVQLLAVDHADEDDVVLFAVKVLFCEDDVQGVVAGEDLY